MLRRFMLVIGSLLMLGCKASAPNADSTTASASNGASFDENAARAEIVASDSAFLRDLVAKHVDSALVHFDRDVVWLADGSKITKGKSEVREGFAKGVSSLRDVGYQSQEVNFSSDHSVAWDYGPYTQTVVAPNGNTVKVRGNVLNVWRNVGGRWLIVASIGNTAD